MGLGCCYLRKSYPHLTVHCNKIDGSTESEKWATVKCKIDLIESVLVSILNPINNPESRLQNISFISSLKSIETNTTLIVFVNN